MKLFWQNIVLRHFTYWVLAGIAYTLPILFFYAHIDIDFKIILNNVISFVTNIILVYVHFIIFDKYFLYRKYLLYLIIVILLIFLTAEIGTTISLLTIDLLVYGYLFDISYIGNFNPYKVLYSLIFITISTSFRYYSTTKKEEETLQSSRIEQLNENLQLLKSYINPKFLFNSLEYLFILSKKKSFKIPDYILKLSDLIRYMQESAKKEKVYVKDEISFIKKYIAFQNLRLRKNIKLDLSTTGASSETLFEPMLIHPFVEHSVQYCFDSKTEGGLITINLHFKKHETYLMVESSISSIQSSCVNEISIPDLATVKKRLDLLYQDKYVLDISETHKTYCIELRLFHEN